MYSAYMIRNDGKEIPVKVHPYGNPENVEETLYAAQWLYKNTKHDSNRRLIFNLIKSFAYDKFSIEAEIVPQLKEWQKSLPYVVFEDDFLDKYQEQIEDAVIQELEPLNALVCNELNQEFLRVRLGGLVNSNKSSKEMVFRVSSVGFDWFHIIYMFVANHRSDISSVTIVKDEEATGYENYFYQHKGEPYNQLPINEFLSQSGKPVVESLDRKQLVNLAKGYSLAESFGNINYDRMNEAVLRINYYETEQRIFVNGRE